jgi:hypothetical protein
VLVVCSEDPADQAVLVATKVSKDALEDGHPPQDGTEDEVFCGMLVHGFILDILLLKLKSDR